MAVYLPENVFAVCTNQLNSDYKQFNLSDNRQFKSVKLGTQNRVFLVKIDKKLSEDFECKSGWSSGLGTVAFGGGVIGGMLLVAATAATVPVAGWIVGGAIAIAAIGYGLWQMSQRPTCSEMIGFQESQWKNHHMTVHFDSNKVKNKDMYLALTKNSMLACKEGGILLPFISRISASSAANSISLNNNTEKWVNIGSGLIAGVLFGFSMGASLPVGGFLGGARSLYVAKQTAIFLGFLPIGYFLINPLASSTATSINAGIGDGSYENIKGAGESTTNLIQPTDSWDPYSVAIDAKDIPNIRQRMVDNKATKSDIAKFESGVAEAQRQGTYSLKNNPDLKEIIIKMKNGDFGIVLKDKITNKSGNLRGMINERNVGSAANIHNENGRASIKANTILNIETSGKVAGGIITLIAPFVSSFFAENAIRLAAEDFSNDNTDSIAVNANDA
ncbi:hypothetical protein B0A69_02325 [Chryseobacterium shigense]|uniref:DUF4280 domain-containing protein n=1 Tax=Chryseobacterium shigense TaxID=297244 RepID=A0A1N7I964_9FLAO|nr:hypothetical protein [Chryseobacterium shigense]PQA96921.1 hypothetical protein B0A69_02325 [Chryseobacterium shigense]SIS33550.1 hypothetical protein SAMN05421639_102666 [Chryseobacterium shigense]